MTPPQLGSLQHPPMQNCSAMFVQSQLSTLQLVTLHCSRHHLGRCFLPVRTTGTWQRRRSNHVRTSSHQVKVCSHEEGGRSLTLITESRHRHLQTNKSLASSSYIQVDVQLRQLFLQQPLHFLDSQAWLLRYVKLIHPASATNKASCSFLG